MLIHDSSKSLQQQKFDQIKALSDFVLPHPFYRQAFASSSAYLQSHTPTLVVGSAGVGLTTLAKHLEMMFPQSLFVQASFSLPPQQNWRNLHLRTLQALYDPDEFVQDFSDTQRGCRVANLEIEEPKKWIGKRYTLIKLVEKLMRNLAACQKNCIIVDNAQYLFSSRNSNKFFEDLSYFNSLLDSNINYLLVGNHELLDLSFSPIEQLCLRVRQFDFPDYDKHDYQVFQEILDGFQPYLVINEEPEMQDVEFFQTYSIGRVGILKDWLVRAFRLALEHNDALVSKAHFEKTALSTDKIQHLFDIRSTNERKLERIRERSRDFISTLTSSEKIPNARKAKRPYIR
ncbi:ATP-binding protein [Leptolyngbya sp. PL-A3]|uniref:ATP-binding protein n=1 Tax=Leptolyngbya sp. PL-A3 TaxID=2933911 RepID=UPI003299DFB2